MISIIAAMTEKGVIGKGNELPWHIPEDLKNFKRITQGCTVIMGSRTYQSIGRPLPNRHNIVLSPDALSIDNVDVCLSIDQALQKAYEYGKEIFVIGGAYTYAQFLPSVDRLYMSFIKREYDGDVFFPPIDWAAWKEIERHDYPEFEFVVYERR